MAVLPSASNESSVARVDELSVGADDVDGRGEAVLDGGSALVVEVPLDGARGVVAVVEGVGALLVEAVQQLLALGGPVVLLVGAAVLAGVLGEALADVALGEEGVGALGLGELDVLVTAAGQEDQPAHDDQEDDHDERGHQRDQRTLGAAG